MGPRHVIPQRISVFVPAASARSRSPLLLIAAGAARRLPGHSATMTGSIASIASAAADRRSGVARLRRRLGQALRRQSRRQGRLDQLRAGAARADALRRGGGGDAGGGGQGAEGFRSARRLRQGARRRRPVANRPRTCWRAPIRPSGRTGRSCRCRARSPTGSATTTARRRSISDALKIAPGEPVGALQPRPVLRADQAAAARRGRRCARRAPARAPTRACAQNLALVLALEGKFAEAEQISRQDMSAQAASANVAAIRQMIAQNDSWRDLQTGAQAEARPSAAPAAAPGPAPIARRGGARGAACARRAARLGARQAGPYAPRPIGLTLTLSLLALLARGRLRLRLRRRDRRRRRPHHPAGAGAGRPRSGRGGGDQQARRGVRLRLVDARVSPRRQDRPADDGRAGARRARRLGARRARAALRAAPGALPTRCRSC